MSSLMCIDIRVICYKEKACRVYISLLLDQKEKKEDKNPQFVELNLQ